MNCFLILSIVKPHIKNINPNVNPVLNSIIPDLNNMWDIGFNMYQIDINPDKIIIQIDNSKPENISLNIFSSIFVILLINCFNIKQPPICKLYITMLT